MRPLEEFGAVYVFSTSDKTWSKLLPTSDQYPIARSYHSCTATSDHIIIHGGCPPPPSGRLSDVWAFNIITRTWSPLADAPGKGRGGTAIAVLGGKLWRFGGFDGVGELGGGIDCLDLAKLQCDSVGEKQSEWSFLPYQNGSDGATEEAKGPGARSVTALIPSTSAGERLLVIMGEGKPSPTGGHDAAGNFYDDVWSLDPKTGVWEEVNIAGASGTGARGWFDADSYEGGAIVWGGLNSDNEREGDGWALSLK